ncbi:MULTISPECIES: Rieske 2Fe-2S domain-containing protein [Pseudomonas]|uniref:Nitrite reductase/ring-hydroxylating ferredoxin subunit n=1 Tax=Pseudomonas hunanensis TaxID=1247546 RepID=A0ACC6K1F8_9PSED|nr:MULTISPECIES: Rieske 2Fe-2S domain-containing protein [Pseudomonas]MBP2260351.1 nitrite reductase/ring-hydroxylating ferredoxin subunit [Pseudomonas sp. BP8]MDR6712202.1 nitrite reductase/ring-hydroxylating ferredoxin subunit [Pseudomonas hunanensis]HDS1736002.1 Rieske 2Fe-2S domain-containing protein [Pseudomonas putida]
MHFLCTGDQLAEGQSRAFSVAGQALFGVRRQGQVFLYRNRCPHKGIPLNWAQDDFLDDSASLIHCAQHGALFLIESGECVAGPCEGEQLQALDGHEDSQGIWLKG